jgi:tRNA(Ile)-lysidine synthase
MLTGAEGCRDRERVREPVAAERDSALRLRAQDAFAPFAEARGALIAVSGGPDSMALLRLAADHLRAPVFAATVDHGLRAAAAEEAAEVARWCAALAIPHHTLVWDGPKPQTRVQELARQARYALLADCARRLGCDVLMTGHHADDQAETVLFRLTRGSGVGGLAGMARVVARGGLAHARPLLDWRKAELARVCAAAGQAFFSDPSNRDPRFARTRMRALAGELARHGLDTPALTRLARRMRQADAALEAAAAGALADLGAGDGRSCGSTAPGSRRSPTRSRCASCAWRSPGSAASRASSGSSASPERSSKRFGRGGPSRRRSAAACCARAGTAASACVAKIRGAPARLTKVERNRPAARRAPVYLRAKARRRFPWQRGGGGLNCARLGCISPKSAGAILR